MTTAQLSDPNVSALLTAPPTPTLSCQLTALQQNSSRTSCGALPTLPALLELSYWTKVAAAGSPYSKPQNIFSPKYLTLSSSDYYRN